MTPRLISEDQMARWTDSLRRLVDRLKRLSSRRAVRVTVLVVILPLFLGALVFAWIRAGIEVSELALAPILAVMLAVPLTVVTATWQLHAMTRAGGAEIRWWPALRVVTLGTLSSLLPVSSGTVVRGSAVVYWGVAPRAAGVVVAFDATVWISASLFCSGLAAFLLSVPTLGLLLVAGGAVLLPVIALLARALPGKRGRLELASARAAGIGVDIARLVGCFLALGYSVTFLEVSALAAAGPLASVVFFLPGGLGVREGFTSAMAAAIGLSAAGAFLAAVLNRLIGLSVLLAWEASLLALPGSTPGAGEE